MKKYCFVLLCFACGCSGVLEVKNREMPYEFEKNDVTVVHAKVAQPKYPEYRVKAVVKSHDVKKYDVKVDGKMKVQVFADYMAKLLGLSYVVDTLENEDTTVECAITSSMSYDDVVVVLSAVLEEVGYGVVIKDGLLSVSKKYLNVEGENYALFVQVEKVGNKYDSLVNTVRLRVLGSGLLLLGKKSDVISSVSVIRMFDVDVLSGLIVKLLPYSMSVCDRVKIMFEKSGNVVFDFYYVSESCSALVLKGDSYLKPLLDTLSMIDKQSVGSFYYIPLKRLDVESAEDHLKTMMPGVKYVLSNSGFIFGDYLSYRNALSLFQKVDILDKQLFVQMYLLDIQSRKSFNMGADIAFNNGQFRAISSIRDSVGLGLFGSYKDFSAFFNILMQRFDGKVITSPSLYLRNNTESTVNFGQSIPTLRSKSETTGGALIQSVEYVNVGLGVTVKPSVVGDVVYTDLSVYNSSVLEGAGVEGNPQFSNDSVKLSLVSKLGNYTIVAGLLRSAGDESKRFSLVPFNVFKKREGRELLLCLRVDDVSYSQSHENILEKFKN